MRAFYFTFGNGTNLADNYVKIEAEDEAKARDIMVQLHGMRWAFSYSEEEFLPQINEFRLTEVPLGSECYYR